MLNQTGIKKETLVNTHQILFNVQNQMSVGIKLAKNSNAAQTVGTRKIVKAGTPLNGDLKARDTAFVKAVDSTNPAVGVLLHDVDVTDADANGTLLIWGFVNMGRLESDISALITSTRETELAGRVFFLKDN
jgi:hypothetical protein